MDESDERAPLVTEVRSSEVPEATRPPLIRTLSKEEPVKCPIYFGVKSYLHHFYGAVSMKSSSSNVRKDTDDQDFHYLILPKKKKCSKFWFKLGLIAGGHLLLAGFVIILIGFCIPKRSALAGHQNELAIVDKIGESFNKNLDVCKVVGLVFFCSGGLVLVITLLFPTFLYNYCDDSVTVEAFKVMLSKGKEHVNKGEPKSPTDKIPVTKHVKPIQPRWTHDSSILAKLP